EDQVGPAAKQPAGVLGEHRLLADELCQIAEGLQDGRAAATQNSRPELARDADEQRCQQEHDEHLRRLCPEFDDQLHTSITSMSAKSSTMSAANTRLRYWRMVRNCRCVSLSAAKEIAAPTGA